MRTLYHFPLCPFSRKVRILLAEKGLNFELSQENFWERRKAYALINPAMQVPAFIDFDELVIPDSYAICEYLEGKYPERKLLGETLAESAEIRRLVSWFDNKFYSEVTRYLLNEKVIRFMTGVGAPNSDAIRAAKTNMVGHLEYIKFLTRGHKWLAGDSISLADIAAAAHISILDFLGEVAWDNYHDAKEWYAQVKSRPSFRAILQDRVRGYVPPKCYANLDF
ncbi:MAG: Glutathione S-transferase family protein [Rickettsiaceae bacterium]|jgi:glutathione S-transferase|nr:Glutathione S-transferase family protein [Rickettsiaceae bacterium]